MLSIFCADIRLREDAQFCRINSAPARNRWSASPSPRATNPSIMKNDPLFSFTAAIVLAGVVATFVSPEPAPAAQPEATPPAVQSAVISAPVAQFDQADSVPAVLRHRSHWHATQKS